MSSTKYVNKEGILADAKRDAIKHFGENSWVNDEPRDYGINRGIDVLNEFSGRLTI